MPPSRRRSRRRALLILAVCAGLAVAALSIGGWIVGSGSEGTAPVAAVVQPSGAAPSSAVSSAAPRVSLGPGQAGAGASRSPRSSSSAAVVRAARAVSSKKGAVLNPFSSSRTALSDSGVSWYYNWAADPQGISAPSSVQYVPQIWGSSSVTDATLASVKQRGDTLLGFNEPDFANQSNLSVGAALDLWPRLQATGMRLGSPAPAFGAATDGSWFDQFMTGAQSRGYRVDFIALHWYGGDFTTANAVSQLKSYLQATWEKWHKPIWLTEYALIDFANGGVRYASPEQEAAFATASTAMMDGLSYVERYSWFIFSPGKDGPSGTSLYNADGSPTTIGDAYRAAGQ